MTDSNATELREKLTERGVEYEANDGEHVKETCWPYMGELMAEFAEYDNGTTRFTCDTWCFTPEQAIAATLGSERIAELEAENERLRKAGYEIGYHDAMKAAKRGGTLTAEQVSKATYAHSIHADCADADWQAIADELNAELGSGACKPKWTLHGEMQTQEFWRCECGNCGYEFGVEDRSSFPFKMTIDKVDIPNYCPYCGKVVENAEH